MAGACGDDGELRHEVQSLRACGGGGRGLSRSGFPESSPGRAAARARIVPGPYEIQAVVGTGGCGEVYKARDIRLDRLVAIKIISDGFDQDPERVARFTREAHFLAALNHPHIAALYAFEEVNGSRFLVMELVDGETLAARLRAGPLALEEALVIAGKWPTRCRPRTRRESFTAILKPANIALTGDGQVKVLDFGLAKALDPTRAGAHAPAVSLTSIHAGRIMGTASYMAPEQAKGRPADKSSDVWAFGCVLYEMLAGRRAFEGEDVSDTLAAVLRDEPDWLGSARSTSALDWSTAAAMSGERADAPARRYEGRAAPDRRGTSRAIDRCAADDGRTARENGAASDALGPDSRRGACGVSRWSCRHPPGHGAARRTRSTETTPHVLRTFVSVAPADQLRANGEVENLTEGRPSRTAMVLSPDGRSLVFSAVRGATQQLFRRDLDQLEAVPIAGTEGGASPFFSPDGRWVGFRVNHTWKKVPLTTGTGAVAICESIGNFGATWGSNDIDRVCARSRRVVAGGGRRRRAKATHEAG